MSAPFGALILAAMGLGRILLLLRLADDETPVDRKRGQHDVVAFVVLVRPGRADAVPEGILTVALDDVHSVGRTVGPLRFHLDFSHWFPATPIAAVGSARSPAGGSARATEGPIEGPIHGIRLDALRVRAAG